MSKTKKHKAYYPEGYMKQLKKNKAKRMRNKPIDKDITEQFYNDAKMLL